MKAARAVDLDDSVVEPWGLAGDRRWLLVDEDGRFVSQREEPSLARVVVAQGPGAIDVSSAGLPRPPDRRACRGRAHAEGDRLGLHRAGRRRGTGG